MKTRLLHLIFCVCAFHLEQVQSDCIFIHTDGEEYVVGDKSCFCGPEKIPDYNKTTEGPNSSNSPNFQWKLFTALRTHQHKCVYKKITNWKGTVKGYNPSSIYS